MFAEVLDYACELFLSIAFLRFKYILSYEHTRDEDNAFDASVAEEPFIMMLLKTVTEKVWQVFNLKGWKMTLILYA